MINYPVAPPCSLLREGVQGSEGREADSFNREAIYELHKEKVWP